MGGLEAVLAESEEEIGLSYSAVADYEEFHEIVIACLSFHYKLCLL